ncbi:MAG TPA: ABC transporter ATP-binding protein [Planctomycetes bacterium]|nr:ABC transporter ATP-binding protein [Planctomycetota bacterium]
MSHLLEVEDLSVRFETRRGKKVQSVQAVGGLSFHLDEGETLGLVGESGSGKTVSSLSLIGLIPSPPGRIERGRALFQGEDLLAMAPSRLRRLRGNSIAMVFQDPMTSLNPLLTIGRQLTEVAEIHLRMGRREARRLAAERLGEVGIPSPEARLDAYPHELSGGMRQRVGIAMALMCRPKLLLADEPTTALDVTIQAQILELLRDLQERMGMAIVLVTHDLGVVAGMADRIAVMYAGSLVETGPTEAVFRSPAHPYTRGLLGSVPRLDGDPNRALDAIEGQPPDLAHLPGGCAFAPRCPGADAECAARPPLDAIGEDRALACFHALAPREEPTR